MSFYDCVIKSNEDSKVSFIVYITDVNIKNIPETETFALACLLDLWSETKSRITGRLKSVKESDLEEEYKTFLNISNLPVWQELNNVCFSEEILVKRETYKKIVSDGFNYNGRDVLFHIEDKEIRDEYEITLGSDFETYKKLVPDVISEIKVTKPQSRSKERIFEVTFKDEKMIAFIKPERFWTTRARR